MTGAEFRGVDVDLLADYLGGALTGTPNESVVATLVADDPAWRAAYESLGGGMSAVTDELGRLRLEPMPDDVVARLEAALASPIAEAGAISAELAAPPAPHLTLVRGDDADDVRQENAAERGRRSKTGRARRLRWVTPIAIAAGVVAFVGFGLDYLAGRDSSQSDTTASSGAGESAQQNTAAVPSTPRLLSSGTDYTRFTLAGEPVETFDASGAPSAAAPLTVPDSENSVTSRDPLSRLRDATALQQCLDAIAAENGGGEISTQTVDFARYDGSPAIVVRFSAANGSWAWAAGSSCGTGGDANTLDKVPVR